MLDRTTYPSLDALAADVEAASGFRVQILIDDVKDGFAAVHRPADDNPQTLVRVAARFADHAHAIAAVYLAGQLRSYRPGNSVRAALKQDVVDELNREVVSGYGRTVPADKLPGLTRIFYDGISRQLTSVLPVVLDHRLVSRRCGDLQLQHRRFLQMLIELNVRYLTVAQDQRNPRWLVAANQRLLGVETLALAGVQAGVSTGMMAVAERLIAANPVLAERGLGQHLLLAIPPAEALLSGLLDDLTDRQLADQAARIAGIRTDWLEWITPNGDEAPAQTPILPKDLAAPRLAPSTSGAYAESLQAAIKTPDAAESKRLLLQLAEEGGIADQQVMAALAVAHERLGEGDEAMRVARVAIGLDTSTDEAEAARGVINRVSASRVHGSMSIRPDVVEYLRDAISTYRKLGKERATGVWREAAMLGMGGIALDGSKQYALKSLGTKLMSGVHLTCFTYAGTRLFGDDAMLGMLGLPYDREWELAAQKRRLS